MVGGLLQNTFSIVQPVPYESISEIVNFIDIVIVMVYKLVNNSPKISILGLANDRFSGLNEDDEKVEIVVKEVLIYV